MCPHVRQLRRRRSLRNVQSNDGCKHVTYARFTSVLRSKRPFGTDCGLSIFIRMSNACRFLCHYCIFFSSQAWCFYLFIRRRLLVLRVTCQRCWLTFTLSVVSVLYWIKISLCACLSNLKFSRNQTNGTFNFLLSLSCCFQGRRPPLTCHSLSSQGLIWAR